jgi:hypothetical protein
MSLPADRSSALLAAMTDEPTSTSELYDRVGYSALMRLRLIPYDEFRRALALLAADGSAEASQGRDGETLWRRPQASTGAPPGG